MSADAKDEANRHKNVGVLGWVDTKQPGTGDPDFASPSFPQPKKDTGQIRFLTGFEELNKHLLSRSSLARLVQSGSPWILVREVCWKHVLRQLMGLFDVIVGVCC